MKTTFKVGDKVWDDVLYPGKNGEIVIVDDMPGPVVVKFEDQNERYYADGRYYWHCKPTLSKVPYTFQLPEQPVEFEEGDPVLVRDYDVDNWFGARFSAFNDHEEFKYKATVYNGSTRWRYCIPFDIEKMGRR